MNEIGRKNIFGFIEKIENSNVPFVPNCIFPIDRRSGRTSVVKRYLRAIENKRSFSSKQKFLEFDFTEFDYKIEAIERMIGEIKASSGLKNDYEGIISIGLDPFCMHTGEAPNRFLIEKLKELSEKSTLIMFVSECNKESTFIKRLQEIEPVYYVDSDDLLPDETAQIAVSNVGKFARIDNKDEKAKEIINAIKRKKIKNIKEAEAFLKKLVINEYIQEEVN